MIKTICKGIVIGIANIIPGVSGGTMAVSMGIYDKLIHAITHIKSEFKKGLALIIPIVIGVLIALIGLSFIITPLFEHFPIPTNLLFVGLIVGGLPAIGKKVKGNAIRVSHIIAFVLFFVVVVSFAAMGKKTGLEADLTFGFVNVLKLFGVGIIASATMVIPGVSGSMILLLIGYYEPITTNIRGFIKALVEFDVPSILQGFGIFIPLGIGVIVGIIAIAKMIEFVFKKFPLIAYWAIIGLIIASPFAILLMGNFNYNNLLLTIVASVCSFIIGFIVAMKLGGE